MKATPLREKAGTQELDPDGCMGSGSSSVLGKWFGPVTAAPWRPELMRSIAGRTKGDAKFQTIGTSPGEQMAALTLGEPMLT